ncbi:MAG: hypothetical protein R3C01_16245, partial [Planctomycetaceae bacterium]
MNHLTSMQRKLVYLVGMLLMGAVILWLGAPGRDLDDQAGAEGVLSGLRREYRLGDATFGNVDPASSTMTLVLLGFRGIAADVLWMQSDELKKKKNWSELERSVESIVLLQPHFRAVWQFQSWNLAFNVSAEFDDVKDRFFWVKRGAKFLERGIKQNQDIPELYHDMGNFVGRKIARSDEQELFRKYFIHDPDERFDKDGKPDRDDDPSDDWEDNGADPEINPEGLENYLVAYDWFVRANDCLYNRAYGVQRLMATEIFVGFPYKALMDYARTRAKDGQFDEITRAAWVKAYKGWTEEYGTKLFSSPRGDVTMEGGIRELTEIMDRENAELRKLGVDKENLYTIDDKIAWQQRRQEMVNYRFWKKHCEVEQQPEMIAVRKGLYDGRIAMQVDQDPATAQKLMYPAMIAFDRLLDENHLVDTGEGVDYIEDAIEAVIFYRQTCAGLQL